MKSRCTNKQLLELWALLDQTTFTMAKARDKELKKCGLSLVQGKVIILLKVRDYHPTIGELSRWLFRDHSSTSSITNRMMQRGLIRKHQDAAERRLTRIAITKKGEKLFPSVVKRESLLTILSILSRDECLLLKKYLKKILTRAIQEARIQYRPDYPQTLLGWVLNFFGQITDSDTINVVTDSRLNGINRKEVLFDIVNSYCPPDQLFVWMYLDQSAQAIARVREKELENYDLSMIQSKILSSIKTLESNPSIGELATLIYREHNSISQITDRMERKGLLNKYRDPQKKHLTRIAITNDGEKTYKSLASRKSIVDILSFLSTQEYKNIKYYLEKLLDKALQEVGAKTRTAIKEHWEKIRKTG
jgi:DNA-binding MarR family transcriptional regulator